MARAPVLSALLVTILLLGGGNTENIVRVGNDITLSTASANWDGTTFLLNNFALADGIVFAFAGWFVNDHPMTFQIWRPVDVDTREYYLVHEWPFQATAGGQREDVYIHTHQGAECVFIQSTDRLGIYTARSPGAIAYHFDIVNAATTLQFTELNLTATPTPGDVIQFDSLAFPYRFSAAAYIDTDLSAYADPQNPSCPTTLLVPPDPTDDTATGNPLGQGGATGATGPEGATGPQGPQGPGGVVGATGPAGYIGTPGQAGIPGIPGRDGAPGTNGLSGPPGPPGPAGADGETGPPGVPGDAAPMSASSYMDDYTSCSWCKDMFNPYMSVGFLVWLIIVSIILVILVVIVACNRSKDSLHYTGNMRWTGSDLWRAYNDEQISKSGYDNGGLDPSDQQTQYSYVEEGRTAF